MILLQAQNPWMGTLMIVAVMAGMYFLMIRPQQNKQKKEREFQANLKKGDKVVTVGGVHAKVVETTDHTVSIQTSAGQLIVERSAISLEYSNLVQERENGKVS